MTVTDTVGVLYKRGVTGSEPIGVYLADTPDALSRDSHRLPGMDLKDATLMILNESAAHPSVAKIAQAAYDHLASGQEVDHRVLDELVGEPVARACSAPSGKSTVPRPTRPYSRPFFVKSTRRSPSPRAGGQPHTKTTPIRSLPAVGDTRS